MAEIKIGRKSVFVGNYWDFHPGCHGTELCIGEDLIDCTDEWTENVKGPSAVGRMIANKIGARIVFRIRKTPIL